MPARKLATDQCRVRIDPATLSFETTAEVEPANGVVSQERGLQALELGLEIRQPRFHVVVVGSPGSGRTFSVRSTAERIAKTRKTPDDLLLLPNPDRPSEPTALFLPAGTGRAFVDAMSALYGKLVDSLHAATEGERFKHAQTRAQRKARREEARLEQQLADTAAGYGFSIERSGDEIELRRGESEEPASDDAVDAVKTAVEEFESKLADVHEEAEMELRAAIKAFLADATRGHFAPVVAKYAENAFLADFFAKLETAVSTRIVQMIDEPRGEEPAVLSRGFVVPTLLTEHVPNSGGPVVEVAHPTLSSLFGRSHSPPDAMFPPEPGFAVAGALHEANGGFLILPAAALLKNELLYEHLKACLLSGRFIVPEQNPSYYRGAAEELLFPSIPLDVKVILVAGPTLFQDLHAADPEFSQLFKIQARFESTLPLEEAKRTYPAFLSGLTRARQLLPLSRDAVCELIFHGGRLAESQSKVTSCLGLVAEVATEASYISQGRGIHIVDGSAITAAIDGAQRRGSHFRDALHELLTNGTIRIETSGAIVGQVNAISVLSDGPVAFGRPCRVTAVVYPGQEGAMNIAREVEMSGPIHSKGVLVLNGYLASRFAQRRPLSFSASLVFEQTYEAIDGDSASSSELYALLSALSGLPLRQDLAVTGSVDQGGSVQPVGGLNEKIEAFFDVCLAKGGLTGTQGVLIPAANVDALMLRGGVIDAIDRGLFHIYAISTVDEGIELLTGVPSGSPREVAQHGAVSTRQPDRPYPDGTVFSRAEAMLDRFYEALLLQRRGV
ncbi:MAG: AAA family ATPase [Polyangiaceae bacterium]|nr:AAA family ATPase [Polyangiaceae bacterium]